MRQFRQLLGKIMGVFNVEITLRNWQNQFLPEEERGEEVICEALVDTGASELCLPADVVETLNLVEVGRMKVRIADGGQRSYRLMGMVEIEVQGRSCQIRAVELPRNSRVLLGAFPLEEMDWRIAPKEARLIPNPAFPDGEPTLYAVGVQRVP